MTTMPSPSCLRESTRKAHQAGAAAVEFALILPVLLAIIFATVEFGFALYDKALITDASREAARAGVVVAPKPTAAYITQVAVGYYCSRVITFTTTDCTTANANVTVTGAQGSFGSDLTVTVTFPFRGFLLNWLMGALGKYQWNITATSVMRNE